MGWYVLLAVFSMFAMLCTAIVAHTVGARVRLRRQSESPYRGGKITSQEWTESCLEAFFGTLGGMYRIALTCVGILAYAGVLGFACSSIYDGIQQNRFQDLEAQNRAAEIQEEIERQRQYDERCERLRESIPDPNQDLAGYWNRVETMHVSILCPSRSSVEDISAVHVAAALDYVHINDGVMHTQGSINGQRGFEWHWLSLVRRRNSPHDRLELARRLYGIPSKAHLVRHEMRVKFLILRALALSPKIENTSEIRDALEYAASWRQDDTHQHLITIREMARMQLRRLE